MNVKMASFGGSLSSRLLGREVFKSIHEEAILAEDIVLDFEGINLMTMSFGTELFDSLNNIGKDNISTINMSKNIESVIKFCRANLKPILA